MAVMQQATLPKIHFFRPGRHTAMSGQTIEFTAEDLAAAAAAYDPAKWQAPIVIGHPAIDAPAYGWVKRIDNRDGELYAEAEQVEPAFAELVRAGRYKKVSAAWFTPGHPRNPTPGVYYLKHIGFLGAAAPAVAGLKPVEFGVDADDLVIEFAAASAWSVKRVFRALREWLLAREGIEVADRVVPEYEIDGLELPQESSAIGPAFTQPPDEGDVMSEAEKARIAELESENAALRAKIAAAERAKRHAEHVAFAEAQVKAGRMTPAIADAIVATLDALADMPEPPQFGEGETKAPLIEALKSALASAPVVVDFSERSAPTEGAAIAGFAAPDRHAVDPAALDLHRRALAWLSAHPGADYLTAVKAVSTTA